MWGEPELNPSTISDFIPSRAVRAELKLDFYSFCSVYTRSTARPSRVGLVTGLRLRLRVLRVRSARRLNLVNY